MVKRMIVISGLLIIKVFITGDTYAQDTLQGYLYDEEQKIKSYFKKMHSAPADSYKEEYNDSITSMIPESFDYAFDSLSNMMGKLKSPDKTFRIYNWNVSYLNGRYNYFGYIQYFSKEDKVYKIYTLADKSDEVKKPENEVLDYTQWYGALYYTIIPVKYKKNNYYTLLALDLNNMLTKKTKKIVRTIINSYYIIGCYLYVWSKKRFNM